PDDIIIFGDDSEVVTDRSFSRMAVCLKAHRDVAILSAAVRGFVGNERQREVMPPGFRLEESGLCFICVLIPRWAWLKVGELDERFLGYGCEDSDYCHRVVNLGLKMAICDEAVVHHGGKPST